MDIYLYQLSSTRKLKLSLSIQVDLRFWQERGRSIQTLYRVTSMNQAIQLLQQPVQTLPSLQPIPLPTFTLQWEKVQAAADLLFLQFQGRSLLADELIALLRRMNGKVKEEECFAAIQYLFLQKKVQLLPGVEWGTWAVTAICHRCSAGYPYLSWRHCATCGGRCAMCNYCYLLGRSRSCAPLLRFASSPEVKTNRFVRVNLPHQLTPAQQQAVRQIRQSLASEQKRVLFWAVTGAGKTECLVPVVKNQLEQGHNVLWVTPRKDVVLELAPRLKRIFSTIHPIALYGGSSELGQTSSLVVATAHQALRYYQYFSLAIVDEVDAFPLYRNPMLTFGIERALTVSAKQVLVTATPPDHWRRVSKHFQCSVVVLPIRHHGYPLPVPIMKKEPKLWLKIAHYQPVPTVDAFVRQVLKTDGQAILFVPRLKDLFALHQWLQKRLHPEQVESVYAQDLKREQKIQQFRQGKIRFLISTTILERGVTVSRCHVAVVGADHIVFDRATLIQIAGRVGRSAAYQLGTVWLIAQEKTDAQIDAIKEIKKLNRLAKKAGFWTKGLYSL